MSDPRNEQPDGDEPIEAQGADQPQDGMDDDFGEANDGEDEEFDGPYTSREFHTVTQKLILNAVYETLVDTKLDWDLIAPFLESAREIAHGDFDEAQIRLHTVRAEGDQWVEAEEAYLGISVADRDTGEEWLSETRWLSELAVAEDDPEQVRRIIAALQRSIGKLEAWLAEKEAGGASKPAPPA
jgi:uncharacterized small protein (DUF1192 family)